MGTTRLGRCLAVRRANAILAPSFLPRHRHCLDLGALPHTNSPYGVSSPSLMSMEVWATGLTQLASLLCVLHPLIWLRFLYLHLGQYWRYCDYCLARPLVPATMSPFTSRMG